MVDRNFDFPRPFGTPASRNTFGQSGQGAPEHAPTLVPKPKARSKRSQAVRSQRDTGDILAFNDPGDLQKIDELVNMDLEDLLADDPVIEPAAKFLHVAEEDEDDLAAKMQILVEKLKEYKDKITELRSKNLETAKESYERSQELERLKFEKALLEEELANSEASQEQLRAAQYAVTYKKDRRKDDERRRGEMTRELLLGANFIEGDFDITGKAERDQNCCDKFLVCIVRVLGFFVLLRGVLYKISLHYDKSIVAYFGFYKFLVNASLLVACAFAYLLVVHLLTNSATDSCVYSLPCWLLYSSFDRDEAFEFSLSLVGLVLLSVIGGVIKWVRADFATKQTTLYAGKTTKEFASAVFNGWNWSHRTPKDVTSSVAATAQFLKIGLSEQARARAAADRTRTEKAALRSKRLLAFLGYLVLLSLGLGLVGLILLNEHLVFDYWSSPKLLAFFMPKVAVSIVNIAVPALTLWLTGIEDWDTPSYEVKMQLLRVYFAKVLNLAVFVLFQLDLAWNASWFGVSIKSLSDFSCPEDQAGVNFMLLVLAETLVGKLIPLFNAGVRRMCKCSSQREWRREIKVSQQVIESIYFQLLLWTTFPFFPYIAFAGPLLLLIDFLFQYWKLRSLQTKPQHQDRASDLNIFIMRLYNLSLLIAVGFYTGFMLYTRTGACGCFTTNGRDAAIGDIDQVLGLKELWKYVLDSAQFFWILCFLLLGKYAFTSNHAKVNTLFIRERDDDYDIQLRDLNRTISSLQRQVALNKKIISK